jgi:hypothetical protein
MFDFDNTEFIMKVINMREAGMIVMPLYVKVYNDTFSMLDIDTMTVYNPAGFKVGFGACVGMGIHDPFPTNVLLDYDVINVINYYIVIKVWYHFSYLFSYCIYQRT